MELLHELVPTASVIVLLVNPTNALTEANTTHLQAAAQALGLQLHILTASTERDFDAVSGRARCSRRSNNNGGLYRLF